MLESAIEGLTPNEISERYALDYIPLKKVRVKLKKGNLIRVGIVQENFGHKGGAIQIDTCVNSEYVGEYGEDIKL